MKRSIVLLFALSFIIGFGSARAQNKIVVDDVTGDPGADVTVAITVTSENNIAGAEFVVSFDQTKLQVKEAAKGADAGGLNPWGVMVIDSANADGTLEVSLIDLTLMSPMEAGEDKELYVVTFNPRRGYRGRVFRRCRSHHSVRRGGRFSNRKRPAARG